jgi:excisionase family DNA binding protein
VIIAEAMKKRPDKKLTITEAAKRLGVTRQAVHRAIQWKLLKAKEEQILRKVWLISESALEDYRKLYSRKPESRKAIKKK